MASRARAWSLCVSCLALGALGCEGRLDSGLPRVDIDSGMILPGTDGGMTLPGTDSGMILPGTDSGMALPGTDSGPRAPCDGVTCGANERCAAATGTCECAPGFVRMGAECSAPAAGDPEGRTAADVCARWEADHQETASSQFTPGADRCSPGPMTPEAIDDTVRRVNLFRWMVGLGPVAHDEGSHARQQACAVIMDANGSLSHSPPMSWTCWSAEGAAGAGASNIALGYGTSASTVDGYVTDDGVPSLGHRRWVLNGPLGRVSMGFVGRGGCLGVFDRSGSSSRAWTAWPPPGPVPTDAFRGIEWWSVHSNSFDFGSATVRVTDESGNELPIEQREPDRGFGANAIAFRPMGWEQTAGATYRVTVTGAGASPIEYTIRPTDCR